MDILINYRRSEEDNKEFIKVLYMKNDKDIHLEVFKKDKFSQKEISELIKYRATNVGSSKINIFSDLPVDTYLIKNKTGIDVQKEEYQTIRQLKKNETSYDLTEEDFSFEHEINLIPKRKEISLFLFKKYKKILLIQQKYHYDKLIDSQVDYLDSTIINSENVNRYIKKTDLDKNTEDYQLFLRPSGSIKKANLQLRFIGEVFEQLLNQKVELLDKTSQINYRNPIMKESHNELDKQREVYLKTLQNPENVVIFTDGSAREQLQSSSFIIRYNGKEDSRTYLFDENLKNYEEVALLKSLEYVFDKNLHNKKIFIISDYDKNVHILDDLKNKNINHTDEGFKNLYYKVFNDFKEKPLDFHFSAIKSHTNEDEDFDFVYNRNVDRLAGEAIMFQDFIPKECFMTEQDLFKNELRPLELDTPRKRYHEDYQNRVENSKLGFLERNKAKRISNRNPVSSSTFVIISKEVNQEKHVRFAFKHLSSGIKTLDISTGNRKDIRDSFRNFIDECIKDKNLNKSGLRFFYQNNEFQNMVKDEIEYRIDNNDPKFIQLKERHSIAEGNYNDSQLHKKHVGQMSVVASHNAHIKKNILKLKEKPKKSKAPLKQYQDHSFKVDFSHDIFGEEKIFPAFEKFHPHDVYFFFNKHKEDRIKLTYIQKQTKKDVFFNKDNMFFEFNELLRNMDSKGTRNCMISTIDKSMKDEFIATFNREANLDCNVVKILDKKYARNRLLILEQNEYQKYKADLPWHKDIHSESNLKKSLKQRVR